MTYIARDLEEKIVRNLKNPEIIAVLGPRQAGKTTLLKHIFETLKNAEFLSFEDRELLELFMEDEKSFAELYVKNKKYLFIDEFQYAKDGGKKLKFIYDTYPKTKIIISGSSAPGLTVHGIKYLVGRIFVFNLYPLSFGEFLRYKDKSLHRIYSEKKHALQKYFTDKGKLPDVSSAIIQRLNKIHDAYVIYGGYPRAAISKTADEKKTVLKNIYNTYFLREIKDLLALTTDFSLAKLIKALSIQTGGLVAYNSLSEVSGFDYKSLLAHLNVLEKTFICKRMLPFYTNKRTELVKIPKVYFFDNGFRNTIIGDFRPYGLRQDVGQLNENFIFSELTHLGIEVKFWRSKSKAEVDFIIEKENKIIALESKSSFSERTKSLMSFKEKYAPHRTIIACRDVLEEKDGLIHIPVVFVSSLV